MIAAVLIFGGLLYWAGKPKRKPAYPTETVYKKGPFKLKVSMEPLRTIYDEQKRLYEKEVICDTSNGRMIDGHPLRTQKDWERWAVYDKQASAAANVVRDMLKQLESPFCADPEEALATLKLEYAKYVSYCPVYGLWNSFIDDRAIYIPTPEQAELSRRFLAYASSLVPEARRKRDFSVWAEHTALAYIEARPEKSVFRADLIRQLSHVMDLPVSEAEKAYRVLYRRDVLREFRDGHNRICVCKASKRKEHIP